MNETTSVSQPSSDEESIAGQFVHARLAARSLPNYPGVIPADLAAGYRCQDLAMNKWPDSLGGWKVTTLIPADLQPPVGHERLIGPVFASNIRGAAMGQIATCPVFADGISGVEPEIVVRLARNAPPEKLDWSIEEAGEMVGEMFIGIEVVSSPLPTLLESGLPGMVSDFCGNFGIVIGSSIPEWRNLTEIKAQCFIEDTCAGRGVTTLRDGPLSGLAFLLSQTARRGRPLRAGAVITTGTITNFHQIQPGQSSRIVFEGIGEVRCRAVQATAHSKAQES